MPQENMPKPAYDFNELSSRDAAAMCEALQLISVGIELLCDKLDTLAAKIDRVANVTEGD